MEPIHPEMTADDVLSVLTAMEARGVGLWLDGGWAVDACLGAQTRRHADLDIVIEHRHLAVAIAVLRDRGFASVPRPDTREWNFVLGDHAGHQVDFHVVVVDEHGRGIYGPAADGKHYPAESLMGKGTVKGRVVSCISPEWLVRFHTGYPVDETDWADVSALCERFGLTVPSDYTRFR